MKLGRNDPCECGSGKKYKKCCLPKHEQTALAVRSSFEQGRGTGWTSSTPSNTPVPTAEQVAGWPIVRAWVPVQAVFAATGYGVAGVMRRKDDGAHDLALFMLRLTDGGIFGMTGKTVARPEEADEFLRGMSEHLEPFEVGDASVASRILWACHALGDARGGALPPQSLAYLALLPPEDGHAAHTLDDLAGPENLLPQALVNMVHAQPRLDTGETTELAVLSEVRLSLADPSAAAAALTAARPPFDARGEGRFDFTQPSQAFHRAPMSRIPGRRVQGSVAIEGSTLVARAATLSMMSLQLGAVCKAVSPSPTLASVRWFSPSVRQEWSWDAESEPLRRW